MATYDELYGNNPAYTKDAYGTYRDAQGNIMYDMAGAQAGQAAISTALPGVNFNGGVTPADYSAGMLQPDNSQFSYGGQTTGNAGTAYDQQMQMLQALMAQQQAQRPPQASPAPQQIPTYGSPYNPVITPPNPDGSGRPLGSTHPVSGMVNLNTAGQDYDTQLQNYYKAYFGGASPDMGMVNDWYKSEYKPGVTGYTASAPAAATPTAPTAPVTQGGSGGGGNFTIGGNTQGSGSSSAPGGQGLNQMTQAASLQAMALSENPAIRSISPVAAAALGVLGRLGADSSIDSQTAADQKAAAIQTLASFGFQTISDENGNIRSITSPASIAAADEGMFSGGSNTGRAPGFGQLGNSSFGEGQY